MDKELEKYFLELCKDIGIVVLPEHYPDIKDKRHLELWVKMVKKMSDDADSELKK